MRNWLMVFVLVVLITQLVAMWSRAKKAGKNVQSAILPSALLLLAWVIMFVHERLGEMPGWIELALLIPLVIILAFAFWLLFVQAKQHMQDIGLTAKKKK
jgi:protein-S-isoprenylcysteine O-methyltransferase Ste14